MRRALAALVVMVAGAACTGGATARPVPPAGPIAVPLAGGSVRHFDLVAVAARVTLGPGVAVDAWTYNGTVPGPQLTVTEGDVVEVTLHNRLHEGTTLHWHGVPVPNGEDGVAGVTQDPVPPGGSATYRFLAKTAGTFWYHSHDDSAVQVDRGLYGALVVQPRQPDGTPAVDATLVYDEWPLALEQTPPPPAGDFAWVSDVTYTVNGRTGSAIAPVRVEPGRLVRLRFVNAGYFSHYVHLGDTPWRIVALDGHELAGGPPTTDAVPVGPGERVDVEFTAPAAPEWLRLLDAMPPAAGAPVPILPGGAAVPEAPDSRPAGAILDLFAYPARSGDSTWPAGGGANRVFAVELSTAAARGPSPSLDDTLYEINGKRFPDTGTLDVETGDLVQLTFVNHSKMDHPMHLHGHAFQVLAVDGKPPAGVLVKDTVVVGPGRTVSVGFRADNPGWWMLHCHELYHARGGMMILVRYLGSPRRAEMGGPFNGVPD